ncbi:MAG TPA: FAD binding domain-containing protein [Candidatus Limnocylindrales bacterium]|nr:FAD binding domain-containing protein [Candidatus Limnocylindrales bacterium]
MIPRFSLLRPRSLDEGFAAFVAAAGEGAWIAGGTELLQVMKMGLAQFATLIDVKAIPELHGIAIDDEGGLVIGAGTTHRLVERSAIVRAALPGLATLAARIANVRVRNTGTLGGNLAFAEPHSDPATFLLACGAAVRLVGPGGARDLPIGDFVLGPLFTAREADELLVSVRIPAAGPAVGRAYAKLAFFERPAASVAVRLAIRDGHVAEATVVAGSLSEVPTVVEEAGRALDGSEATGAGLTSRLGAAAEAFGALDVVPDLNGSADYKRHLAGVLLHRAAQQALVEAHARA